MRWEEQGGGQKLNDGIWPLGTYRNSGYIELKFPLGIEGTGGARGEGSGKAVENTSTLDHFIKCLCCLNESFPTSC